MELQPLTSSLVKPGDSLIDAIVSALLRARIKPRNGDILAVSSKVVAIAESGQRDLSTIHTSSQASSLARKYSMDPRFVQVVLDEADKVYSGVPGAILTLKDGDAVANSGVDQKNSLDGHVVPWPRDPDSSSRHLRSQLEKRYGKKLGVVIVDSRVTPLRLGTIGLALSCAGFKPVDNLVGQKDLFGRRMRITSHASGDGIACAAHLLMGESTEKVPFVLVRNAPVKVDGRNRRRREMIIPSKDCLYMSNIAGPIR